MTTETVPQTIDVTGLAPDAVRAVEAVVAAFRGPAPAPVPAPNDLRPPADLTPEEWVARWNEFVRLGAVHGVVADDSRESIYDRSTE